MGLRLGGMHSSTGCCCGGGPPPNPCEAGCTLDVTKNMTATYSNGNGACSVNATGTLTFIGAQIWRGGIVACFGALTLYTNIECVSGVTPYIRYRLFPSAAYFTAFCSSDPTDPPCSPGGHCATLTGFSCSPVSLTFDLGKAGLTPCGAGFPGQQYGTLTVTQP